MKSTNYNVIKYEADEGKVFDWAEPRFIFNGEKEVQDHLYARIIYLGVNDSIDNYIEVDKPQED